MKRPGMTRRHNLHRAWPGTKDFRGENKSGAKDFRGESRNKFSKELDEPPVLEDHRNYVSAHLPARMCSNGAPASSCWTWSGEPTIESYFVAAVRTYRRVLAQYPFPNSVLDIVPTTTKRLLYNTPHVSVNKLRHCGSSIAIFVLQRL